MIDFITQANKIRKTDFLLTFAMMNENPTVLIKDEFKKINDHIKVSQKRIDIEKVSLFKLLAESKEDKVDTNPTPILQSIIENKPIEFM